MSNNYEEILRSGLIKVGQKKYIESKESFLELIEINDKRYEGYLNLSNILVLENKQKEAKKVLINYLKDIAFNSEIVNGLAIILFNSNQYDDLSKHIELYINKNDNHLLNYLKGFCLNHINKPIEAENFLKKSIVLNSSFWPPYELLFNIYDLRSKLAEMKDLLNSSKKLFINNFKFEYFEALYNYRISKYEKCYEILNRKKISDLIEKNKDHSFLSDYYNLLSKNFEKLMNYQKCLEYALKRNKSLINIESNKGFKKKELLDTIDAYKNFYTKNSKSSFIAKDQGLYHSNLTFLIGFPRSGTTLLDTILRSHSKTMVIEEKPYLLNIRHNFFKKNHISSLLKLDEKNKIKMQEKYFDSINYDPKKIIIDKFPLNLIELGFIKTIFPNSKIILAIRHPLDCILSCVLTAFKMNEAMLNFENLQTTSFFYNKTFSLLTRYIDFFTINLYQIKYENVVLDFNNEINKLLNFLELNFENSLTKFYDTAKKREKIHTPSYDQVIKPLYSNSINRHLNFKDIETIIPEIEKWIYYYSYENPIS